MQTSGKNRWRRLILFSVLSFVLIASGGALYEILASRADMNRFPRPFHLVGAGALRLNLHCTGRGTPTIVLEAGLADSLDQWRLVQPEVARFARVCSYDRAGYGYSDPGPMPRTSARIASELHAALQSAGEAPPFVMAGSSFGGYCVRVFNGQYPSEVAAILLVDSTQEDQYRLLPPAWSAMSAATRVRARSQAFWAPLSIGLGMTRFHLRLRGQQVPPVLLQAKYIQARTSELENIETSAEQARVAEHMNGKALVVLTAGRPIDAALRAALSADDQRAFEQTWVNELQLRLARLSTRGKRIIVQDSGHDIPGERPEAVVAAIRELCNVPGSALTNGR
ncbi:MAG: alpha/beta hydrolase [Acidobacteria bacterium]|nr:alpha/beta hydrolase [Acidobacteriota bacterium]